MIKDVKNYISIVGNRLSKAFTMEEFGTEEELEFWNLAAEHMSRKETPSFVDIVNWVDLLYRAPVHYVHKLKEGKLVLNRRHIISENILNKDEKNKMPHEQSPQQKEYIQNFEHQIQNIEKKMDWDEEFREHGISSHTIGKCEHIPLYTREGEIWGVYFVGPYIKCPEQIVPKMSIVGRLLSSWLIELEETDSNPIQEYGKKVEGISSNLGTGKLNTGGLANLTIRYMVNALNAEFGLIAEIKNNAVNILSSTGFESEDRDEDENEAFIKTLLEAENDKIELSEAGKEFFSTKEGKAQLWNFKGKEANGCILLNAGTGTPNYSLEEILDDIKTSVANLLDYRESNIEFSNEYLETYYQMLRAIEKSRKKTTSHTPRMIAFVERFGLFFGLDNKEMEIIRKTAKFHDIGYVGATGLEKGKTIGGELTHPILGANLLSQLPIEADIVEGVKTHHEWVNGQGTPEGLTGDDIPWTGKIIGVFEYVVDFVESYADDDSKEDEEWLKMLSEGIMQRADTEFDMVLIPTVIQLIQALGWEACTTLGVEE